MTTQEYKARRSELQAEQRHAINNLVENHYKSVLSLNDELLSTYAKKWTKLKGKRVSVAKNSQSEPLEIIYEDVTLKPHMNCDGTGIIIGTDPNTKERIEIDKFVFGEGKIKEVK